MKESISNWLNSQYPWIQEAASRLLTKGSVDETDVADFVQLVKSPENPSRSKSPPRAFPEFGVGSTATAELRLISIGDIVGIDKLAPKQPLEFSSDNLSAIYGKNGSGKSGYARILKKICGKANAPELKADVFSTKPANPGCVISFALAGETATQKWIANSPPLTDLGSVDIFDSYSSAAYLESETTVSFSPPELVLFSDLVTVCKRVEAKFTEAQSALKTALPQLPLAYQATKVGKKYVSLTANTGGAELSLFYPWTEEDDRQLSQLNARRATENSGQEAKKRREIKAQCDNLRTKLNFARSAVSTKSCTEIAELITSAANARAAAKDGAEVLRKASSLDGIGSETWKALWNAARSYSVEFAYLEKQFPNVSEQAKCVLCQQSLDDAAKKRLLEFESHVTGTLEREATAAEARVAEVLKGLPNVPDEESFASMCQAAALTEESIQLLKTAWNDVAVVAALLRRASANVTIQGIDVVDCPVVATLNRLSEIAERDAMAYEKDAQTIDLSSLAEAVSELEAKKWTAAQQASIETEIVRLKEMSQLKEWAGQAATAGLSRKAGELSETLITEAYISRFNNELQKLGASRIRVELVKSRVQQGLVKHKIQLVGQGNKSITDILSDGEQRIVTLAAFLATVMAKAKNSPFVFDDPISSLDQDYEEKTAERLIELSADRQVIIFTHRLSLLSLLQAKAEKIVAIRNEAWGSGQPGVVPIFATKPRNALQNLKDGRLNQARRELKENGQESYYPLAKSICSDIRSLLERVVELDLLADVVQRYRRDVHTKNKINNLAKIEQTDCALIDRFMTKYSKYEHSQSSEAPVELPEPVEIESDLDALIAWLDEFKARRAR